MLLCAQRFIDSLKEKEIGFDLREGSDGDVLIRFMYDGKPTTYIFSGPDGCYVTMLTHFENVPAEKLADMYAVCNSLNAHYKWLKFYVDKDNDLMIDDDAIVSEESAADECFELLIRRFNIIKDAKPEIMRGIYC